MRCFSASMSIAILSRRAMAASFRRFRDANSRVLSCELTANVVRSRSRSVPWHDAHRGGDASCGLTSASNSWPHPRHRNSNSGMRRE